MWRACQSITWHWCRGPEACLKQCCLCSSARYLSLGKACLWPFLTHVLVRFPVAWEEQFVGWWFFLMFPGCIIMCHCSWWSACLKVWMEIVPTWLGVQFKLQAFCIWSICVMTLPALKKVCAGHRGFAAYWEGSHRSSLLHMSCVEWGDHIRHPQAYLTSCEAFFSPKWMCSF